MDTPFPVKKAIVTGGSSGLGYAVATALLKSGSTVVNVSRTGCDLGCEHLPTDLTDNASIAAMVETVRERHQDCDLLVSCAGLMHWAEVGNNPLSQIDNDLAVNLTGMIKVVDGIMPLIKKNRGDVVIVGSTSSFTTSAGSSLYCAAKHGVVGYIKALQTEFANQDVRIHGIHPGGFKSQFHIKAQSNLKQEILMDPNELAAMILSFVALPRNMQVSEIIINRKNLPAG
jgi:NADP-dependent 3-hydroxy acid dehydrogenase YdfG